MLRTPIHKRKQVADDLRTLGRWGFYTLTFSMLLWMVISAIRTILLLHTGGPR
jgi:hypothetical protein